MDAKEREADVVIVGGGPVGMGLAIELGQRDLPVIVVERHPQPQPIPKGQNLTQRTMEHFHFWGVEAEIRKAVPIPAERGIGGLTAYGSLLSDYHYDWYQRVSVRPFYFTDNERLPQYATEEVLRRRVADLPSVEVLYGWSAEDIRQECESASADMVERESGERKQLRCRYLVGCDGSRSIVRDRIGITQTQADHDAYMVLLVFRSRSLNSLLRRYAGRSFFNVMHPDLDGYWQFFGRVDPDETWFFHAPVPPGTSVENFDFRAYLHRVVGAEFDCELTHVGFWDLRFAIADDYRAGRVFIAGDAAHSHPPYGGFGINSGFEDARNLGWKLAATLQGWGGEALLESYSRERQPVFASTAHDFIEKFIVEDRDFLHRYDPRRDKAAFEQAWAARVAGASSDIHLFGPHYEGSPVVLGPPGGVSSAVGAHRHEARSGHHLSPQALSSGRNVFEQLGGTFTLLAFDADERGVCAFETAARALRVPLAIVRDTFADGRRAYAARLVLVRPDQYVAWCGDELDGDAGLIVAKAAGFAA